jgi:uncharacterized protein YbjQ (UPF0145 family)
LTGVSIITGNGREPTDFEEVKLYLRADVQSEAIDSGEDLEFYHQPPKDYECIGYVEGVYEEAVSKDRAQYYRLMGFESASSRYLVKKEKEFRSCALKCLRKNAARMGANGVFLTSINYERGYSYPEKDHALCAATGWAVYVPPEEVVSNIAKLNDHKRGRCRKFQIFIEPPEQYEALGDISSSPQDFYYTDVFGLIGMHTPTHAIQIALDELKRKTKKMNGNALYIREIARKELVEYDPLFPILANIIDTAVEAKVDDYLVDKGFKKKKEKENMTPLEELGRIIYGDGGGEIHIEDDQEGIFYWKYYVISGQAIKVPCND